MIHLLLRTPPARTCAPHCREADYHANAARAAKSRRLRELHRRLQREAEEKAGGQV
jgi:hypothetical protein